MGQNGGARPGAGRPTGRKSKSTIEREILERAAFERRVVAQVTAPMRGKYVLEELLGIALERLHAATAPDSETHAEYIPWFERTLAVAKEVTKYQDPQYRAIEVAHTDMRPPVLNLTRLSAKQLELFLQMVQLAGPANVALPTTAEDKPADKSEVN